MPSIVESLNGLAKNTAQLFTLFAMANLVIAKRRLFELNAQVAY